MVMWATKSVYILFRIYRPALCWQKFGLIIRVPKWLFESTWFQFHGELQKHDSPSSPNNSGYLIRSELLIDDYVDKKSFQLFIHVVQCQICWQKLWFWHFMYFYKFYIFVNNSSPWKYFPCLLSTISINSMSHDFETPILSAKWPVSAQNSLIADVCKFITFGRFDWRRMSTHDIWVFLSTKNK